MRAWLGPLLVLALAGAASAVEGDEPWPATRAGAFHVLEGDIHSHSVFAGALPTPVDLILLAGRQRLDFIAVVEHNSLWGARLTAALSSWLAPNLLVIPSEEVTTRSYHVHAIGIKRTIDPSLPLREVADETHRQGGVVVAAHPVRRFWRHFLPLAKAGKLDGVESMHPIRLFSRPGSRWKGSDLPEFWRRASELAGRPLAALGGSDYHGMTALGLCRSIVLAKERSSAGVVEAIRAGRTVAVAPGDKLEGNPKWVRLLEEAGYRPRPSRHRYSEVSAAGQVLGWGVLLSLLASLLMRRTLRS